MSTEDFRALNEAWVGAEEVDFRRQGTDYVTRARETYEFAREARESLLFSAWVNTLRQEWDTWCRYYEGRGPC